MPLCAVCILAYLAALLPAVVQTTRTATYGFLDVAVAVSGLAALIAYVVAGWLLGLVARTAFVAPVAFALTIAGYNGDKLAAVAPVLHISPTLGLHESGPLVTFRIAFF